MESIKNYIEEHKVNIAIQVLPVSGSKDSYAIVDEAIKVIQESGIKHVVTPFETVMEGYYSQLMPVVLAVQNICYEAGAEKVMCYLKIQSVRADDVTIEDKIEKYS